MIRRPGQFGLHLIIKHLIENPRKRPRIHAQPTGQIGYCRVLRIGPDDGRPGDSGLVTGGAGGGALLGRKAEGIAERGQGKPFWHLPPQLPSGLKGGEGQVEIFHIGRKTGATQGQAHQIVSIVCQYEFSKIHIAKIGIILYICMLKRETPTHKTI